MTENKLKNSWTFWFHDPLDNNWKINSYKKIYTINSIESFWKLYNNLNNKLVENSMLFLMKNNINPLWEDKENVNGGCWSLKIPKGNIIETWNNISIHLVNENIIYDKEIKVNGISISPKKNFCIIKIWINKNNNNIQKLNKIKEIDYNGIIFKSHGA